MTKVQYLTASTVNDLRRTVKENLNWYLQPESIVPIIMDEGQIRLTQLEFDANGLRQALYRQDAAESTSDNVCSIAVYQELSMLTPHQAIDERLWVWLSHFQYPEYITKRWLSSGSDKEGEIERRIIAHHFTGDSRSVIRDHGLSRLWWLGRTANLVYPDDPKLFLDVILHRQDIRSALIERPSLSMNINVLRAVFEIMLEQWNEERENARLFERESFRDWMRRLNSRGGVVLLDSLPKGALEKTLRQERDNVLNEAT